MNRRLRIAWMCCLALALGVCAILPGVAGEPTGATAGAETPAPAFSPATEPAIADGGNGMVIFFRGKELIGAAVGYDIYEDTTRLGELRYGTYFAVQLPAGRHEFVVNSWRQFPFPLDVEAGKTYYMLGGITTEDAHPHLWGLSEAVFEDMRGSLKDVSTTATVPPPRSESVVRPAGAAKSLIFGRLRVVQDDGTVHFPIADASAPSQEPRHQRLEPNLSLLRIGSLSEYSATRLKIRRDGIVKASVPPGDYILTNSIPTEDFHTRVEAIALLRVPGGAASVYVGDLTIILGLGHLFSLLEPPPYYFLRADVTSDLDAAKQAYEAKFQPLAAPPGVSLWCLQVGQDRSIGTLNRSIAIATLSSDCNRPDF